MDPISLSILIGLAIKGLMLIYIACLYFGKLVKWFRNRTRLMNKDKIAFSIQEKLKTGEYKTCYGIFNTRTNQLEEGKAVVSAQVDQELADVHEDEELVVYR